jgi:hypothetical protein
MNRRANLPKRETPAPDEPALSFFGAVLSGSDEQTPHVVSASGLKPRRLHQPGRNYNVPDGHLSAPGQGIPNPVTLFRDDRGVYGIGFSDDYLLSKGDRDRDIKLVLRPDRINETKIETSADLRDPILQRLPPWQLKSRFRRTQESLLREAMIDVMRQRAGIEGHQIPRDANLRRHYFGLAITATRMFNGMMARVVASADPEALRVARRFPLSARWSIYRRAVRSHRVLQIAETFPLLAYRVFCKQPSFLPLVPNEAIQMIERGAKLRDIAQLCGLPLRLRRIKPGAVHYVLDGLINQPKLLDYMPQSLPKMRQWMRHVTNATHRYVPDYTTWVARNWEELNNPLETLDIGDWAANPRERPFVPTMSVRTVRQLSAQWHETQAALGDGENLGAALRRVARHHTLGPFPNPWFPAHTLTSGEEIVPIVNSEELIREGRAMHHCVVSYGHSIISEEAYIYSLRKGDRRIATIELRRDRSGKAVLGQIRGACNAAVPSKTKSTVQQWLASQNGLLDRNA